MDLRIFSQLNFLPALKALFKDLQVPVNYLADEPTTAKEILKDTYKETESFQLMDDVYFLGMVDDAAFEGNKSVEVETIKSDYNGILIFGITLKERPNGLLPTRSQLAEIARAFNREFFYTPVVVVFQYGNYLAFANTERLTYKQEWRDGEKAGKVSLLRDIDIHKPHSGHERILKELKISATGKNAVDSFAKLYAYWQEVFSVSILNKKFYQELSDWYFWARSEVRFPGEPLRIDFESDEKFAEANDEHNGKNVIRLLTRILFVWFIKEKGLIPKEIFDEKYIVEHFFEDFEPQKKQGIFATGKHTSKYYRAVLQNLFFATLNCEKGKRDFRKAGIHQNVTSLMRYKSYFKNPNLFLKIMESQVPFMNGGLFDCLDKPHAEVKGKRGGDIIIYQDGFSDKDSNFLSVPDFLFFDKEEIVDLSKAYGQTKYQKVNTKGLLKILESYKFTITENTPIEEDVALDPELLGRVFENLLASYNPETKTTARKQTGSFYTPREIVNYMVDESLVAYLKNAVPASVWQLSEQDLDAKLHELMAFDNKTTFDGTPQLKKALIKAIDNCKILDPACGSGAFPMGILQKMVHVLHKIDPENEEWQQRQLDRMDEAIASLSLLEDADYRDKSIKELSEQKKDIRRSFENNELDYGRKLYLIENCIYGVDIQSIAVQISKLRFFISLIVDQHIVDGQDNFGIRPLPNLETKFVAANTLIGIAKPDNQLSLFDNEQVKELEKKIKSLNQKLFSNKSPARKRELKEEMKAIRNQMAEALEDDGLENKTARTLTSWDPFDQNASSPFFDPEWMFDIQDGFDIVIGNPPYGAKIDEETIKLIKPFTPQLFCKESAILFVEIGKKLLNKSGTLSYIVPKAITYSSNYEQTRLFIIAELKQIVDCGKAFEQVKLEAIVFLISKNSNQLDFKSIKYLDSDFKLNSLIEKNTHNDFGLFLNDINDVELKIALTLNKTCLRLGKFVKNVRGAGLQNQIISYQTEYPVIGGKEIARHSIKKPRGFLKEDLGSKFPNSIIKEDAILAQNIVAHIQNPTDHIKVIATIPKSGEYFILDTINQIIIREKTFSRFFLWAVLNSKLANWYIYRFIYGKAIRTMHFDGPVTDRILIPTDFSWFYFNILHFASISNNQSKTFLEIIDSIIFNLYFPEHMNERGINVLEYVEQDIESVMQGRAFESLSEEEKEVVIQGLHNTWSNPTNEVVKRMALFAEKSPDILKPILES